MRRALSMLVPLAASLQDAIIPKESKKLRVTRPVAILPESQVLIDLRASAGGFKVVQPVISLYDNYYLALGNDIV